MEKIKYIVGNEERAKEIQQYFEKFDKSAIDFFDFGDGNRAYYIHPYSELVSYFSTDEWQFKALVEAGVFEELKYPYSKPKLKVIQGVPDRGDEVIKLLESMGGKNNFYGELNDGFNGVDANAYYFVKDSTIHCIDKNDYFFKEYDLEVLSLPGDEESTKEPETAKFVPFVSKVLVRNNPGYLWMPAFFFSEESEGGARWYHIVGTYDTYRECIPYEGNEELAFTRDEAVTKFND